MADILIGAVNGLPLMRQQFLNVAILLRRQTHQDIFQIGVRIVAIELGRLNQAHDGRRPLALRRFLTGRPTGSGRQGLLTSV